MTLIELPEVRGEGGNQNFIVLSSPSGVLNVRDDDINKAVLHAYDAIETVRVERRRDWNTVLMLRWVTLISKLSGHTLLVLGRNIGEWPADVDLLNDVSVSYYAGLLGRAVYNVLFVLSDFRHEFYFGQRFTDISGI